METTQRAAPGQGIGNGRIEGILQKNPVITQVLRFAAVGFLNTGLSFVVANLVSKYFGIVQGNGLGASSGAGFLLATLQSYYWNKYWAFGQQSSGLFKNFLHLVWVGLLGVLALGFVYLGSQATAPYYYYLILLAIFLIAQLALWHSFGLGGETRPGNPFISFFIVSLVGFFINFFIASRFSVAVHLTGNGDLNKNLALVAATAVSMIWNFVGYKMVVFKK
ncbi:MAG: GtrA family protein [Patescibacteria group bacterium]|nr:GtrA family protein [Patescibacteria group bacterium]